MRHFLKLIPVDPRSFGESWGRLQRWTSKFLRHLGLEDTVMQGMLVKYPCFGWMDASCGLKCDPASERAVQCATLFHCSNCSFLMKVLGGAWHLPSAVEVITRTILRASAHLLYNERCVWHNWNAPSHEGCNDDCPLAPKVPGNIGEELNRHSEPAVKANVLLYHQVGCQNSWRS